MDGKKNKREQEKQRKKKGLDFDAANYNSDDAGSEFQQSFYGPVYSDYESVSEGEEQFQKNKKKYLKDVSKDGYEVVSESHRSHPEYKWVDRPTANKVRWHLLTGGPKRKKTNVLHIACSIGFKEAATMIVIEAKVMGILDNIINTENKIGLTPIYLLCEQGNFRSGQDEESDEDDQDKQNIEVPEEKRRGTYVGKGKGLDTKKNKNQTPKPDESKEEPLIYNETIPQVDQAGGDDMISQDAPPSSALEERLEGGSRVYNEVDRDYESGASRLGDSKSDVEIIDHCEIVEEEIEVKKQRKEHERWAETGEYKYAQNRMRRYRDSECREGSRVYLLNLLLQHNANPNVISGAVRHTPMHWLCYWGDWRAVKLLLAANKLSMLTQKTADQKSYLDEHGAFNLFLSMDGATPIDVAGDLGHRQCCREIVKHYLQPEQQRAILDAFTNPWIFERYGQQRYKQQKTKLFASKPGKFSAKNMEGVEIVIGFAKSKVDLTAQQRSLLQLAFWALTMAKEPDPIEQPKEYEMAKGDKFRAQHLLYIFVMDLGVSPFVKCYDDVALITGLVRSGEFTILRDLLKHKYITIYYEDFSFLKKQLK